MSNYTQEQLELKAHIEAENEKFVARCKAEGATAWCTTVSDLQHWADYGIYNIKQYERYSLTSYIYDAYKDAHGFRPRHFDFDSMSMVELEKLADRVSQEVTEAIEQDRIREKEATTKWKEHLGSLLSMGAKSLKQALIWDMDAEEINGDISYYCYLKGISYTKERLIQRIVGV